MTRTDSLMALALALIAAVATMGIGAFLLRNAVKDTSELASALPTRFVKEDTSEARETNRRKALWETLLLLILRASTGSILVICGAGLLVWTCVELLPMFRG
jgi:hypothetical protein